MLTLKYNIPDMRPTRLAGHGAMEVTPTTSKPLGIELPPRRPTAVDVAMLGSDPDNDTLRTEQRNQRHAP